jgi:DNA-binding NarL/FixJ family response regulator
MSKLVLALVDDLVFASRIQVEAENAGAQLQRLSSAKALRDAVRVERPALIIVDLDGMGFDGVAALQDLREEPAADGVPRLAYGSHVEPERLAAAAAAGPAEAMARSRFVQVLGERVRSAIG